MREEHCACVGDRHAIEHERAVLHVHRPSGSLRTRRPVIARPSPLYAAPPPAARRRKARASVHMCACAVRGCKRELLRASVCLGACMSLSMWKCVHACVCVCFSRKAHRPGVRDRATTSKRDGPPQQEHCAAFMLHMALACLRTAHGTGPPSYSKRHWSPAVREPEGSHTCTLMSEIATPSSTSVPLDT